MTDYVTKRWEVGGKLHREDGPAIERKCACVPHREWYINGKLHREDAPAYEGSDGSRHWYINGKLHREDGPAVEYADGTKYWYLNGKLHREDGPAVEYADGRKEWYIDGKRHREDGPIIEFAQVGRTVMLGHGFERETKIYLNDVPVQVRVEVYQGIRESEGIDILWDVVAEAVRSETAPNVVT